MEHERNVIEKYQQEWADKPEHALDWTERKRLKRATCALKRGEAPAVPALRETERQERAQNLRR